MMTEAQRKVGEARRLALAKMIAEAGRKRGLSPEEIGEAISKACVDGQDAA